MTIKIVAPRDGLTVRKSDGRVRLAGGGTAGLATQGLAKASADALSAAASVAAILSARPAGFEAARALIGSGRSVVLERIRTDYREFAVYTQIAAGRPDYVRWYHTDRLTPGAVGDAALTTAALVKLYRRNEVARCAVNRWDRLAAAPYPPILPKATTLSAAGTFTGTWSAASGLGPDLLTARQSSVVGDKAVFTITGGSRLALVSYANAGTAGIAKVTVKQGGVEIAADKYFVPLSGGARLVDLRTDHSKGILVPLAGGLDPGLAYEVTWEVDASNPSGKLVTVQELHAYDDAGPAAPGAQQVSYTYNDGTRLYSLTTAAGPVAVQKLNGVNSVWLDAMKAPDAGIATVLVHNAKGQHIATVEIDFYRAGALYERAKAVGGLPKGDYTATIIITGKNASSTGYRYYDYGVSGEDYDAAGDPAADPFDLGDQNWSISLPADYGTACVLSGGNVEIATLMRRAADAIGAKDWAGGPQHGKESAPTSWVWTIDGVDISAAYTAAAAGARFAGARLTAVSAHALKFPQEPARTALNAAVGRLWSGAGHQVEVTKTVAAADLRLHLDYGFMLPGDNPTGGHAPGGGWTAAYSDAAAPIDATLNDNSKVELNGVPSVLAFANGEAVLFGYPLNAAGWAAQMPGAVYQTGGAQANVTRRPGNAKAYVSVFPGDETNGVAIPVGTSWTTVAAFAAGPLPGAAEMLGKEVGFNPSWADLSGGVADPAALAASLMTKAAAAHGHIIADVAGLQAALDGKAAAGLAIPIFNMLEDGGRFGASPEPNTVRSIGTYVAPGYVTSQNGAGLVAGPKFIDNNTDYGGTGGALDANVKALIDRMRASGYRRYGPEFHTMQISAGTGTTTVLVVGGTSHYLAIGTGTRPMAPFYSVNYHVKTISGQFAVDALNAVGMSTYVDGVLQAADFAIAPGDGWKQITHLYVYDPQSFSHDITDIYRLYATPGTVGLFALPTVYPGHLPVAAGVLRGPVPSQRIWR